MTTWGWSENKMSLNIQDDVKNPYNTQLDKAYT